VNRLEIFERIARTVSNYRALPARIVAALPAPEQPQHDFDRRNVHPALPAKVKTLFDDGHYSEATFEACKFLDNFVGKHAPNTKAGERRMMEALNEGAPVVVLTPLGTDTEKDEQRGYKFLFAGTMIAIRNPRGHEHAMVDDPYTCLDHLGLVSMLLRRMNKAGYK
jgi:uncharacterized protein (TIGR02391 family)